MDTRHKSSSLNEGVENWLALFIYICKHNAVHTSKHGNAALSLHITRILQFYAMPQCAVISLHTPLKTQDRSKCWLCHAQCMTHWLNKGIVLKTAWFYNYRSFNNFYDSDESCKVLMLWRWSRITNSGDRNYRELFAASFADSNTENKNQTWGSTLQFYCVFAFERDEVDSRS